jgi:hypothetical protein
LGRTCFYYSSAQYKASARSSHADEQPHAQQAADDAEAACAEEDKKLALCIQATKQIAEPFF